MNDHPQQVSLQANVGESHIRSLQSKNTKNLSIFIKTKDDDNLIGTTITGKNIVTTNNNCKNITTPINSTGAHIQIATRPSLLTRRSEASLYSASLARSFNGTSGIQKSSINHFISPTSKIHNINPIHLPKYNSATLSINTQFLNTCPRGRSRSIDTSTPLSKDNLSIIETQSQSYQQIIQSNQKAKNTWAFPDATNKAPCTVTASSDSASKNRNNVDTPVYENVDVKNAYPNGPLLVIPPSIYLYSEPSLNEILNFDLIINVAEEVPSLQYRIPSEYYGKIEYYHVEWSHHSKIVKDLNKLTDLMHKATLQNKKILIHCQCGVSRSASLMVAYIMRYCNMNLNDAYNKLKSIAKDISPNMGLIFQLMEWSEKLNIIKDDNDNIAVTQENGVNKIIGKNVSNDSSINMSLELTPQTPFELNSDHNFTTLDIK